MRKSKRHKLLWLGVALIVVVVLLILVLDLDNTKVIFLVLLPLGLMVSALFDVEFSKTQPNLFDDPLVGREVKVTRQFVEIGDVFEGRVDLNGATWTAQSRNRQFDVGESAIVKARSGHLLEV